MKSFSSLFKKTRYASLDQSAHFAQTKDSEEEIKTIPSIPDGLWIKCKSCNETIYSQDLEENSYVCTKCNYHFRISARQRIDLLMDNGTFIEYDANMHSVNPLDYKDYEEKLAQNEEKTNEKDAIVTGEGQIDGALTVLAVMDFDFMGGSLGSVVGEKITRAVEKAIEKRLPVIIATTSGGARMQEGIFSLMQMAKTSAALARLSDAGLLYITIITDPTTGGVSASYAMIGDIIIAEPGALIGFAGARVIEQTIKQRLPEGFQRAEFLLEKGFVDSIVDRHKMKEVVASILKMHSKGV